MVKVIHFGHRFKQDLYSVKVVGVNVKVTVTSSVSIMKQWLSTTFHHHGRNVNLNHLVVGLGVEWTHAISNRPADTLQLCVGRRCLIFQLSRVRSVSTRLRKFINHCCTPSSDFKNDRDHWKLQYSKHHLKTQRKPLDLKHNAETDGALVDELVEHYATVN